MNSPAKPASPNIIEVHKLVKRYDTLNAVNGISFTVRRGAVFAFLGANGAGKSTTINCLTTVLPPTAGNLQVNGHKIGQDDDKIRRSIGVVFQQSVLDPLLTVQENLELRAIVYGPDHQAKARIQELSATIGLGDILHQRYGTLSIGQKRRADIVRALLHQPEILFLDEPTAGMDPESRERVWQTVYDLQTATGLTVFLTTHYMEETERADEVCILSKGTIVAQGTPSELRSQYSRDVLRVTAHKASSVLAQAERYKMTAQQKGNDIFISTDSSQDALRFLKDIETDISDFEFRHGTMDDVFLELIGRGEQ